MKPFNTQFATQRLRETLNEVKFTIDDADLYSAVMDRYMRGASVQDMLIKDEGDYLETDEETFQGIQAIAMDLDKVDALIRLDGIEETSATGAGANFVPGTGEQLATPKAFKKTQEQKDVEPKLAAGKAKVYMKDKWGWKEAPSIPNRPSKGGFIYKQMFEGEQLNENYSRFKKEANETEWPSEIPSRYGEYIFKLINVMPDGTAKYDVIDAETGKKEPGGRAYRSVETLKNAAADLVKPKGGTQSTQLEEGIDAIYESLVKILKTLHGFSDKIKFRTEDVNGYYNIVYDDPKQITKDVLKDLRSHEFWNTEFAPSVGIFDNNRVNIHFGKSAQEILNIKDFDKKNWTPKKLKQSVNENYSRFKKETKTRTNEQQLHAAMRLAEKKIHEANRILEYTAQLRTELNETKVNKNTQKLMEKITRGIAEAYGKMKKLK